MSWLWHLLGLIALTGYVLCQLARGIGATIAMPEARTSPGIIAAVNVFMVAWVAFGLWAAWTL
jgi:hypothetical protein